MPSSVISGKTKICGVIGNPVEHTMSPVMHNAAFKQLGMDYLYIPFRVKKEELGNAVAGNPYFAYFIWMTLSHGIRINDNHIKPGTYHMSTRVIENEPAGAFEYQAYKGIMHGSTLTIKLPVGFGD